MDYDLFVTLPFRAIAYCGASTQLLIYGSGCSKKTKNALASITAIFIGLQIIAKALEGSEDASSLVFVIVDIILFHALASILIPGIIFFFVGGPVNKFIGDLNAMPDFIKDWGAAAFGFLLLWLMSVPLDRLINQLMDGKIRPHYG